MRTTLTRTVLFAALSSLTLTPAAAGQEDAPDERTILGQVVDDEGLPVPLAIVGLTRSDRAVMTDSVGRFALPVGPRSQYRITAEQLGYLSGEILVPAADIGESVVINIERDPVALAGLEVTVDRFERRRRFYAGTVHVVDQQDLARFVAGTARDVIRTNSPFVRTCSDDPYKDCILRRGQLSPMTICLDERPLFGGSDELELYAPEELYMVELYDWGRSARVYTRWFVERMTHQPRNLPPHEFGC
ncbi:MAG: carboxypeptidase regulatory-like domain-containing protein [Longimicrobiales bacterium]